MEQEPQLLGLVNVKMNDVYVIERISSIVQNMNCVILRRGTNFVSFKTSSDNNVC